MLRSIKFMKLIMIFLFMMISLLSFGQDSCRVRVSLLTCSPGDELYSTFGHSALRVTDSVSNTDVVYNYGTFNFDEPGFYSKFVRGKLKYFVSTEDFYSFEANYKYENRSITEQVLDLTCGQKQAVQQFLTWNLMPQNRYYKYDFTFDNCTTRLWDLLETVSDSSVKSNAENRDHSTFRDAIHEYLDKNHKSWDKLGIDILLGSRLDKEMTYRQTLFLPDNLMKAFDSATLNGIPLVNEKDIILKKTYVPEDKNNINNPLFIFSCLFVLIAFLSFSNSDFTKRTLASFDSLLFFLFGLIGLLLIFMWVGTDHYMTRDNYNLLWAWPPHLVLAFFLHKRKGWVRVYLLIYALAGLLLLGVWYFLPQEMNMALIPLVGILIFRSFLYISGKRR